MSGTRGCKRKSDAAGAHRKILADVRADGAPPQGARVGSDDGGEFLCGDLGDMCRQYRMENGFTRVEFSLQRCRKTQRIIQNAVLTARVQALILFPFAELPLWETLWAEGVH